MRQLLRSIRLRASLRRNRSSGNTWIHRKPLKTLVGREGLAPQPDRYERRDGGGGRRISLFFGAMRLRAFVFGSG